MPRRLVDLLEQRMFLSIYDGAGPLSVKIGTNAPFLNLIPIIRVSQAIEGHTMWPLVGEGETGASCNKC